MTITHPALSRIDAAFLTVAASQHHGRILLPETMTPLAAKRLLGRLLKRALVESCDGAGTDGHALTPAGYTVIGMTAPTDSVPPEADDTALPKAASKREVVLALLVRTEGASLAELIAATGWLPHTTRAALSRLRSAGQVLAKTLREDGVTAYRIMPAAPTPPRQRAAGKARARTTATTSAPVAA